MNTEKLSTGFTNVDNYLSGGLDKEDNFIIIGSRTGGMKSWVAEKMAISAWKSGLNVGYFSTEMAMEDFLVRFKTLDTHEHWAPEDERFRAYLKTLSTKENKFIFSTPNDFDCKVTLAKIKEWVDNNNLQFIVLDGFSFLIREFGCGSATYASQIEWAHRAYKELANTLGITILITHYLNQAPNSLNKYVFVRDVRFPACVVLCEKNSNQLEMSWAFVHTSNVEKEVPKTFYFDVNLRYGTFTPIEKCG